MIWFDDARVVNKLIKTIAKYQYVSFDIFDTLVKRCVADPKDIYINVANDYNSKSGNRIDPREFQKDRVVAAQRAREIAAQEGREETTLNEIYSCFPKNYSAAVEDLMQLEIIREIGCCKKNPTINKVFNWCIENGKVIYIISDMYLPKYVVEKILLQCGYENYEKLYLSSDIRLKKQTGKLYQYVSKDSGIEAKRIIHIGDSFRIDYIKARISGLHSINLIGHVRRAKFCRLRPLDKQHNVPYKKLQRVINNLIDPEWDPYYQYGFEVVGPLLYGFCIWLHNRAIERKIDKLFFLSRDGYLMQRAYQELYDRDSIANSYLYVSRKSLSAPQVWMDPSLENLLRPQMPYRYFDFKAVCELLNVDIKDGMAVWQGCGISLEERLTKKQLLSDGRVAKFFECFKENIINESKEKFSLVKDYLVQEGVKGQVAIVDIGWTGAIQNYLQLIIEEADIDASIFGYYLGLKPVTITGPNAESYIPKSDYPALFCAQLMEYPFTKMVGSTLSYKRGEEKNIIPVLMQYEFEGKEDEHYTQMMQAGAMYFVESIKKGYGVQRIDYRVAYNNLKNVTKRPRIFDVDLLGSLTHVNYGKATFLAKTKHTMYYIAHPKMMKKDFDNSGWKIGFVKKLIKIPLPYDKVLMKVKNSIKNE